MNLQFLSYKIPFKSSFKTARQDFSTRKGVLIKLKKSGITALGEAAPLPGFSEESLQQLTEQIQEKRSSITQFFKTNFTLDDIDEFINQTDLFPSLQFGLFTAAAFHLAQKEEKSQNNKWVKVNAVIDLKKSILPQIRKYATNGFKTIKLKVGPNREEILSQIEKVRDEFEDLNIRLDANRVWDLDHAVQFLTQVEHYKIEFCEEPLKRPSAQNLQALKDHNAIPLALDETMAVWPEIKDKAAIADILIIKPMVMGGFSKIKAVCKFAAQNDKEIVFTSSLGTAVERLATAGLASEFGSEKLAHGLNTGRLLADDFWDDRIFIKNGFYELPGFKQLKKLMQNDLQKFSLKPL